MKMGWSDLPCDLVISIAARLWEPGDYLRFRAVCRSWKSAVRGFRPSFFPWLAAVPCNEDPNRDEISFINHVANDRAYKRPAPCSSVQIYVSLISNNKDGWMMFVPEHDGVAIIFNPLTGAQLQHLPSLYASFCGISKVFLSDNLFAFANVYNTADDGHVILVAAAPGDDTWSVVYTSLLPYSSDNIKDIVFHEADGKFYAMDRKGKLLSFCLTHRGDGKTAVVGEVSTLFKDDKRFWLDGPYLVSCGSSLLQVRKPYMCKEKFEILKYCPDANTWIGMTNINLGNNSIFIDCYGAKLLSLPQGEGRLRRNCIYFIHYKNFFSSPDQLAMEAGCGPYARIYDVSKGIVEPCFSMDIKPHIRYYPSLMWFMPSLSINN